MRTVRIFRVALALAAVLSLAGCSPPQPTQPAQSNFNLIFRYGVGAKNELNTFNGTYTKDMVIDPSITVRLSLTEEELNRVHQKMTEIDFFDYPEVFSVAVPPGGPASMVVPSISYYFKVAYDSKVKELRWDDQIARRDEKSEKLKGLITLITGIIEAKEDYKKLPMPKAAYP